MDDDELLAQLAAAVDRVDPPPQRLRDAAMRALTWDLGIAELSLVPVGGASAAMRGGEVEDMSFADGVRTVDLTIERTGRSVRVFGAVDPVDVELSALETTGQALPVDLDEAGRFEFEASSMGPFALVVSDTSGSWRTPIIEPGVAPPR